MISFTFYHGLGDCANAAHLFALYIRLGYQIEVECDPDKGCLFEAAGCKLVNHGKETHHFYHAPAAGPPQHADHWSGNKTAWNISQPPLPDIGSYRERWNDLCSVRLNLDRFVTSEIELEVNSYIQPLPRPLILFAPQGNTSSESKNLDHKTQSEVLRRLLDLQDGTVITLDWDQRVFKLPNWRIRHLGDDWHHLGTIELYTLLRCADLLIGCDSGVLHFSRFTDTMGLGVWTRHHPSQYALPRNNTLHIVSQRRRELNWYRRLEYNIVECPGEQLSGQFIAEQAVRLLSERKYLLEAIPNTMLRSLVDNCRQFDSPMTSFVDRHRTFEMFLSLAMRKEKPLIVETGTIRAIEDWSAGYSTYLFGYFLFHHGGVLHSIDLDPKNVSFAESWTEAFGSAVQIHQENSHAWLRNYSGPPIDLLYLDSADVGTPQYQECCFAEVQAAIPHLAADGMILFDDTCWRAGLFRGKGGIAVPWMLQRGWKVVTGGYQVLLGRG
jgi:predicted O-methyltransferase YrrM